MALTGWVTARRRRLYHAGARRPAQVPFDASRRMPLSRFARLAIAAAIATYVLIVVGGLVRATDSGLACPDWPGCFAFNDWIPAADAHVWIEHTHRLIAALAVGPMVGLIGLITVFTNRRRDRALLAAAVVAGVLVIVQSVLGRQVVFEGLARELVTAHLAMALTVLAMTILIADRAAHGPLPGRRSAPAHHPHHGDRGRGLRPDAARLLGHRPQRGTGLHRLPAHERQRGAAHGDPRAGHPVRAPGGGLRAGAAGAVDGLGGPPRHRRAKATPARGRAPRSSS